MAKKRHMTKHIYKEIVQEISVQYYMQLRRNTEVKKKSTNIVQIHFPSKK